MTDYRSLTVWKKSIELAEQVYLLVRLLPREETYVLSDQMRRAAISISSNVAEGQARDTNGEFLRFLRIANGSRAELETQIVLCQRLYSIPEEQTEKVQSLCSEIGKMLYALITKLSNSLPS